MHALLHLSASRFKQAQLPLIYLRASRRASTSNPAIQQWAARNSQGPALCNCPAADLCSRPAQPAPPRGHHPAGLAFIMGDEGALPSRRSSPLMGLVETLVPARVWAIAASGREVSPPRACMQQRGSRPARRAAPRRGRARAAYFLLVSHAGGVGVACVALLLTLVLACWRVGVLACWRVGVCDVVDGRAACTRRPGLQSLCSTWSPPRRSCASRRRQEPAQRKSTPRKLAPAPRPPRPSPGARTLYTARKGLARGS